MNNKINYYIFYKVWILVSIFNSVTSTYSLWRRWSLVFLTYIKVPVVWGSSQPPSTLKGYHKAYRVEWVSLLSGSSPICVPDHSTSVIYFSSHLIYRVYWNVRLFLFCLLTSTAGDFDLTGKILFKRLSVNSELQYLIKVFIKCVWKWKFREI